jgi:hypothetical protein
MLVLSRIHYIARFYAGTISIYRYTISGLCIDREYNHIYVLSNQNEYNVAQCVPFNSRSTSTSPLLKNPPKKMFTSTAQLTERYLTYLACLRVPVALFITLLKSTKVGLNGLLLYSRLDSTR